MWVLCGYLKLLFFHGTFDISLPCIAGMNGHEVLNRVEKNYRMARPTGGPVPCPEPYYEIMLKCWNRVPETRPTFAYLQDFFNNYMVAAETEYRPVD